MSRKHASMTAMGIAWYWLLSLGTVVLIGWLGPALDDHSAEFDAADQIVAELQQQERFERAAQAVCGENAGWIRIDETTIQCTTKRGYRTQRAAIQ